MGGSVGGSHGNMTAHACMCLWLHALRCVCRTSYKVSVNCSFLSNVLVIIAGQNLDHCWSILVSLSTLMQIIIMVLLHFQKLIKNLILWVKNFLAVCIFVINNIHV